MSISFDIIFTNIMNFISSLIGEHILPILTNTLRFGLIWIVIAAVLIATNAYYRNFGKLIIASLFISMIIGFEIIKPLATTFRYFIIDNNIKMMLPEINSYGFYPVTFMMAVSCTMIMFYMSNKYGLYTLGLIAIITFANMHPIFQYPVDVLIGILIGVVIGFLMVWIYKIRYEPYEDVLY